ncbi:MAG: ADP-glyceromanno-heptose 6-epimerase [Campylobacterales bacterium]
MRYIDDNLNGKNILITGGAGFIGSNLAFYFQKNHPEARVVVFDSFRSDEKFPSGNFKSLGHFKNLIGFEGEVIGGDINNQADIQRLKNYKFDYIFHEAAISDTTVLDQELMLRTNVNAFKDLLKMAVEMDASMIYASSAGTYGNSSAPNIVGKGEEPENVYGFSKLMMDNLAYEYMERYDIDIVGLRYFNVYGASEYYKGTTASMILQLGIQALNKKKVRLFKYGEQKRDFVHIEDVVQANIKAMQTKKSGVYNVGFGVAREFNHIVDSLKAAGIDGFDVEYFDNPYKFYQNHTEADISKSEEFLGYKPNYPLEKGVLEYVDEIKRWAKKEASE